MCNNFMPNAGKGVGVMSQVDEVSERIQCPFDNDSGSGEELLTPEMSSR